MICRAAGKARWQRRLSALALLLRFDDADGWARDQRGSSRRRPAATDAQLVVGGSGTMAMITNQAPAAGDLLFAGEASVATTLRQLKAPLQALVPKDLS